MRLIDADEAVRLSESGQFLWVYDLTDFEEFINQVPTIEAQPIVYAEWIGTRYDGFADGYPVYDAWECSACGEEYESEGEPPTCNFCPNCGAKFTELN